MKSFLESGLFLDALKLSIKASNKDIINKILPLKNTDNYEILEHLQIAQENLTIHRELYQNKLLPCIDFVHALIENKYSHDIKDGIIQHSLIRYETVKKYFDQNNKAEDSLKVTNDLFIKEVMNRDDSALDVFLKMLGLSKIALIDMLLLQEGMEDLSYVYYDCDCDNSKPTRKKALELALDELKTLTNDYAQLGSLGFSFLKLSSNNEALKCFIKQSEMNKEDGVVLNNMAWCYMRLGEYDKALVNCENALKLLPDHSHVHHDFSSILFGLNRIDEAIFTIRNAISNLKPPAIQLFYLLASIFEKKGNIEAANNHWKLYLCMAQSKPGHERVAAKVRDKLIKQGLKIFLKGNNSDIAYPIRKIADDIFNEHVVKIDKIMEKAKNNTGNFSTNILTQDKYKMTSDIRWTEIDKQCEQLFNKAFKIINKLQFLNTLIMQSQFNNLLQEKEKNNIPYWVLVRDVVHKLIEDIFKKHLYHLHIYPSHHKELSDIRLAIETVICEIIIEELLIEVNAFGVSDPISTIQWICSFAGGLDIKQNIKINIIDIPAMLFDQSLLMNSKIVLESEITEFDYTNLWIDNYLNLVMVKRMTLGTEITLKELEINSCEEELIKIKMENDRNKKELKDRIVTLEKYIQQMKTVVGLLHSIETLINSVEYIKITSGFKAWLFGYKRKIIQTLSSITQVCNQINSINPHLLKVKNLNELTIQDAIIYIQSVVKKEFQEKMNSIENLIVNFQKEKDEVTSTINSNEIEFKNSKRKISGQLEQLNYKIKENTKKREIIESLIERGHFLKNKWPIILFSKYKNLSEISTFFDDSGEIILGEIEEGHMFLYNIEKKSLCEIPNYYYKNFYKVFKLFKDRENLFILCYNSDSKIYLRNFINNSPLSEFNLYDDITSLSFVNSTLFIGTYGMVYVIDIHSSQLKYCLIGNEGKVLSLAVDTKNGLLYSGEIHSDNPLFSQVCVWDLKLINKKEPLVRKLTGFGGGVLSLILSPDGQFLIAGEGVGSISSPQPSKIIIWDTEELRIKRILEGHKGWVKSIAVVCMENKAWIVSGDAVGSNENQQPSDIFIWDIYSWELVTIVKGHRGWVNSISSSKDGKCLISGGMEGIYIWDMKKVINISD